jgi:hypothetical protein
MKQNTIYKVVQIWPGLFVCKQVTVCPGNIWTTLYYNVTLRRVGETIVAVEKQKLLDVWESVCGEGGGGGWVNGHVLARV